MVPDRIDEERRRPRYNSGRGSLGGQGVAVADPSIAMVPDRIDEERRHPHFNGERGMELGGHGGQLRPTIMTQILFLGVVACLLCKLIACWMETRLQSPCVQPPCQLNIYIYRRYSSPRVMISHSEMTDQNVSHSRFWFSHFRLPIYFGL
jgi:hypothetical protein